MADQNDRAFKLAGDGYARGFAGDSRLMRERYRTAHGISRACEGLENELDVAKAACERYITLGYPELSSYNKFVKETISEMPKAETAKPQKVAKAHVEPTEDELSGILSSIEF